MTQDQAELLRAARVLLSQGFAGYAASRAYYSMFYVAQAFLEGEGLAFSKHSAVVAAFGKEFAKTGRVPAEFHGYLIEAQEVRLTGDYRVDTTVEWAEASRQIERAEAFLRLAEERIGPIPADEGQEA